MATSCRYGYLDGSCANRRVESLECVGADKCEFSGLNVLTKKGDENCPVGCNPHAWLGLYCEKYGRFFCPGKEHCASPESYLQKLALHQEGRLQEGP